MDIAFEENSLSNRSCEQLSEFTLDNIPQNLRFAKSVLELNGLEVFNPWHHIPVFQCQ